MAATYQARTQQSVKNTIASTANFVLLLPTQFILRYFLAKYFGIEYLGLNGLFNSILSVLSLVDMGVSASITYALYRPLADHDTTMINALMRLYRRIYHCCTIGVILLGVCLLPFLQLFTKHQFQAANVSLIFLIMVFNMASTYFLAYSQALLIADQRNRLISWTGLVSGLITLLLQIALIVITKNIYGYIVIAMAITIIYNILLSRFVKRAYHLQVTTEKVPKAVMVKLIGNTVGNGLTRFSSVVVSGTDGILISMFVGLPALGRYSNYLLITNAMQRFLYQLFSSVQASIGNFGTTRTKHEGYALFKRLNFINFAISAVITGGLVSCANPLIELWLGEHYVLTVTNVVLIAAALFFINYLVVTLNFISAYGLSHKMKLVPILESLANIGLGLVFLAVFHLGLNGVLIATILSTTITVGWQKPFLLFKHGFQKPFRLFIGDEIKDVLVVSLIVAVNVMILMAGENYWKLSTLNQLAMNFGCSILTSVVIVLVCYLRDARLEYVISLVRGLSGQLWFNLVATKRKN
ncbi:lipopolysaccharide biosynthesis protein [Furfurilactobacillus curtus]|uniref:Sugar translocase n=1 Tax=Furfurilactobacillus curtus TaxID=1746200 RepID=A0ABQ5JS25_9LACO